MVKPDYRQGLRELSKEETRIALGSSLIGLGAISLLNPSNEYYELLAATAAFIPLALGTYIFNKNTSEFKDDYSMDNLSPLRTKSHPIGALEDMFEE